MSHAKAQRLRSLVRLAIGLCLLLPVIAAAAPAIGVDAVDYRVYGERLALRLVGLSNSGSAPVKALLRVEAAGPDGAFDELLAQYPVEVPAGRGDWQQLLPLRRPAAGEYSLQVRLLDGDGGPLAAVIAARPLRLGSAAGRLEGSVGYALGGEGKLLLMVDRISGVAPGARLELRTRASAFDGSYSVLASAALPSAGPAGVEEVRLLADYHGGRPGGMLSLALLSGRGETVDERPLGGLAGEGGRLAPVKPGAAARSLSVGARHDVGCCVGMAGSVAYTRYPADVRVEVEEIYNDRAEGRSGTLSLELRGRVASYDGPGYGYVPLGDVPVGELPAGGHWHYVTAYVPVDPAPGSYWFTVALLEYPDWHHALDEAHFAWAERFAYPGHGYYDDGYHEHYGAGGFGAGWMGLLLGVGVVAGWRRGAGGGAG